MAPRIPMLDDALQLADLLRPSWPDISASIPTWHPRLEETPEEEKGKGDEEGRKAGKAGDEPAGEEDDDRVKADDDWQAKARKHERAAKKERKAREAAEAKLREKETADQTDQEKAIEKARQEARDEALAEAQKERRTDRLEVAVTRLATKGVKVGEGDEAKTVTFADPDDAIVHVERAIGRDEIDGDDIFDSEGKVNTDALTTALGELLERKKHLQARTNGAAPAGDADAGKGAGAAKGADDMSVDDHFQAVHKGRS